MASQCKRPVACLTIHTVPMVTADLVLYALRPCKRVGVGLPHLDALELVDLLEQRDHDLRIRIRDSVPGWTELKVSR